VQRTSVGKSAINAPNPAHNSCKQVRCTFWLSSHKYAIVWRPVNSKMDTSSPDEVAAGQRGSAPTVRWAVTVAAVILGLFVIVAAYFWAHKPFDAVIVTSLGQSLLSVVAWLGVTWLGAALGRRAIGGLPADERPAMRLALSAGVGLGLLSLLTLVLGLVGLLRPLVAWGLVLGLAVLLRRDLHASLTDLRAVRLPQPANGFQCWLAVYGSASLLLTFFIALAPPSAWDTLVYHLTGPRLFVEAGRIVHPIDLPYLGFPQLGEMQFTLGLLLVGDRTAPLFHFGYGLLALVVTASLARRAFGESAAWMAATLLLSVPTLFSLMTRAYVDATLLFYTTSAFYAFFRWRELRARGEAARGRKWLLLMGLFCGFCGGIKYTAVVVPVALGLSLVWTSRSDGLLTIARRLAFVAIAAIGVALLWPLENWLTTGNPVYPFFFSDGVYWDEWRAWWYDRPGTGLATTAPWRLLIAPLEATVLGTEGTSFYEATIGPLLLFSGILLIFVWRSFNQEERAILGHLLLLFFVSYVLWLTGLARTALLLRTRFLLPTFGVVAVLGAAALDRLPSLRRPQLDVDWLVRTVISLTLALLLFSTLTTFLRIDPLPVLIGLESRDSYLTRRLGIYQIVMMALNELPSDSQIVFLWEPRSYACRVDCRPDALLDRFLHLTHLYPDADTIARVWEEAGVSHVLLYQGGLEAIVEAEFDPVTPRDLAILEDLRVRHLSLVGEWGDDAYQLYELELAP